MLVDFVKRALALFNRAAFAKLAVRGALLAVVFAAVNRGKKKLENQLKAELAKVRTSLDEANGRLEKRESELKEANDRLDDMAKQVKRCKEAEQDKDTDSGAPGSYFRALSVQGMKDELLKDAEDAGLGKDSDINDLLAPVLLKKGEGQICPRDGRKGAAYVDVVRESHAGRATIMISYAWGYKLLLIVDTITEWCDKMGLPHDATFFWLCCVCINQHRVEEKKNWGEVVTFEEFEKDIRRRVLGFRHILSLMYPWHLPKYVTRSWCIFELFTAKDCNAKLELLMPKAEEKSFQEALLDQSGGFNMQKCWHALEKVCLEEAEAASLADKDHIDRLVKKGGGYKRLNITVRQLLKEWLVYNAVTQLQALQEVKTNVAYTHAWMQVGYCLEHTDSRHLICAIEFYRGRLGRLTETGQHNNLQAVRLLTSIGSMKRRRGEETGALETLLLAQKVIDGLEPGDEVSNAMAILGNEMFLVWQQDPTLRPNPPPNPRHCPNPPPNPRMLPIHSSSQPISSWTNVKLENRPDEAIENIENPFRNSKDFESFQSAFEPFESFQSAMASISEDVTLSVPGSIKLSPDELSDYLLSLDRGFDPDPPLGYFRGHGVLGHKLTSIMVLCPAFRVAHVTSDDMVVYHYTDDSAFRAITGAKGIRHLRASFGERAHFGDGIYAASKSPGRFGSKEAILLNNYTNAVNPEVQEEQIKTWRAKGVADYCIPLIVPRSMAVNVMHAKTKEMKSPGYTARHSQKIRPGRDIVVLILPEFATKLHETGEAKRAQLASDDFSVRLSAVEFFAQDAASGDQSAARIVVDMLSDPDHNVRAAAVWATACATSLTVREAISKIAALVDDPVKEVQCHVQEAFEFLDLGRDEMS